MTDPKIDIKALTQLARLEVSDAELLKLEKEIPAILAFVEIIQKAKVEDSVHTPRLRNVMRADAPPAGGPHESGIYTKKLLDAAPARVGNRIAVKQVISREKK